jgi:hypothetical protein
MKLLRLANGAATLSVYETRQRSPTLNQLKEADLILLPLKIVTFFDLDQNYNFNNLITNN